VAPQSVAPALLDTNVPMYAAGAAHAYRDACRWVMTEIANGRLAVAIDVELIQEILHRLAVMMTNGLTDIISTDTHFDLITNIHRIDPVALYQAAQAQQP
jgi:predicted nucleic acid-binding protein